MRRFGAVLFAMLLGAGLVVAGPAGEALAATTNGDIVFSDDNANNDLYLVHLPDLKYAWPFILMVIALVWRAAEKRRSVIDDAPVVAAA